MTVAPRAVGVLESSEFAGHKSDMFPGRLRWGLEYLHRRGAIGAADLPADTRDQQGRTNDFGSWQRENPPVGQVHSSRAGSYDWSNLRQVRGRLRRLPGRPDLRSWLPIRQK